MEITIKRLRVGSDLTMRATLTDGGVRVSWQSVDNICAYMYSDAQRVMAGEAQASVDPEDPFTLVVRYTVDEPQYLGINRLVVTCSYMGQTKTYDMPVVEFVELLQEQGTSTVETVAVAFEVSDVTSSILDEVIAAAIAATRDAREAEADIVAAEALREAAETERQQNETERQQAEAERQEGYTEMTRKVGQMEQDVEDFGERLGDVEIVIPSAASEDNKLVDKETLDESIAFNTAHYISNNGNPFASVEELEAYPKERLTNNDYAVVVGVDEDEHTTYTYYVYNSATQSWAKEFVIDTLLTPFTDAQMAALNSGITAAILQSMQLQMEEMQRDIDGKQEQLVSGENIKTVNGQSLLGSGNIEIQGGAGDITDMNALASMVVATPTQQSFIERATPAGGIAYIPKVYGNSVKVVQEVINGNFDGTSGWSAETLVTFTTQNNKAIVDVQAGRRNGIYQGNSIVGHKYLFSGSILFTPDTPTDTISIRLGGIYTYFNANTQPEHKAFIVSASYQSSLAIFPQVNTSGVHFELSGVNVFDLTAMGMDDITTADEFAQRMGYPSIAAMPYIPYTEGTIKNLTATGIESRNAAGAVVASLPLNISDIVRADGTQLFPDGLRSAGSARDMVDRVNGRAEKRIGVVVFDGTEDWKYFTSADNLFVLEISTLKQSGSAISNYYSEIRTSFYYLPQAVHIADANFTTLGAWKAHLAELYAAGNPLVVYYEAAEPETVTFSPMKAFYKTEQGGTERLTGEDSAPIVADMGYKA